MKTLLRFNTPVTSSYDETAKEFVISGEAIHAVTTRNGHTFTVEELSGSARTLQNKPLLKDHVNSVDYVVGKVKKASYNASTKAIDFVARVSDKAMQEKISCGDVNCVSVGAMVEDVDEVEKDGISTYVLKGVEFLELSLVAIPADPKAGFSYEDAVLSCYNNKKEQAGVVIPASAQVAVQAQNEQKVFTVSEEKTTEKDAVLESLKTLTAAVGALAEKVAVMEKTTPVQAAPVSAPVAEAPSAPTSKGLVAQNSVVAETKSASLVLSRIEGKPALYYDSYDREKFPNLSRSSFGVMGDE